MLSFAFPEIREQLRLLVDRHVQGVLTSYVLPGDRDELIDELGSMRPFWSLTRRRQEHFIRKARSVTDAEIEMLLRKAATVAAGLNNASPPQLTVKFQHPPHPPDDAKIYVFSAGLEELPLCPVIDFPDTLPASWLKQTAFLMPMSPSDPFSMRFTANYPFAVKVTVGNLDRVTGEPPLSSPLRVESYFREEVAHSIPRTLREFFAWFVYGPSISAKQAEMEREHQAWQNDPLTDESGAILLGRKFEDELDPQYIDELLDLREVADWDQTESKCCSVHVCNSSVWRQITGTNPPQPRLTAHTAQRFPKRLFIMRDPF